MVPQLAEEERHGRAGAVGLLGRVAVRPAGGGGVHARLERVRLDVDEHNERLMRCFAAAVPLCCRLLANVHGRTVRLFQLLDILDSQLLCLVDFVCKPFAALHCRS